MTTSLPAGAPTDLFAAFAHINTITSPTLDDLKLMVLLEAAGLELYCGMAAGAPSAEVAALLEHNGREELAHAHRVAKAIQAISGESYPPPPSADNPYLAVDLPETPVTAEALRKLAQGEFAGEQLYTGWAATIGNPDAAQQFRQNGKEETEHGRRLIEAADLLEA